MSDLFLFGVLPYLAVALALGGTLYRYRSQRLGITARSSQLLEGRMLYWGSVPWHGAILAIIGAHILAALFPDAWGALLGAPARLLVLEVTGLALGALATLGIAVLLLRRARLASITGPLDWVVLALLLFQAGSGLWVAFGLRWGSLWYLGVAVPWLGSLVRLSPQVEAVALLPLAARLHVLNAFALLALLPLTRLVHLTSIPIQYLWRPPQVVIWRRPSPAKEGRS